MASCQNFSLKGINPFALVRGVGLRILGSVGRSAGPPISVPPAALHGPCLASHTRPVLAHDDLGAFSMFFRRPLAPALFLLIGLGLAAPATGQAKRTTPPPAAVKPAPTPADDLVLSIVDPGA